MGLLAAASKVRPDNGVWPASRSAATATNWLVPPFARAKCAESAPSDSDTSPVEAGSFSTRHGDVRVSDWAIDGSRISVAAAEPRGPDQLVTTHGTGGS